MTSESNHPICLAGAVQFRHLIERKVRRALPASHQRWLYLVSEVSELLDGKSPERGFPNATAEALADRFMAGWLMNVSLSGHPRSPADLERLHGLDEVWAFCVRKPRPGWRIFGRFMAPDCFIGLAAYDRHELGDKDNYERLAEQTVDLWEKMFTGHPPHRGASIGDYLGGVWRDVDVDA